jgi:hypothetical protein
VVEAGLSISMEPELFAVRTDAGGIFAGDSSWDEVSSDCAVTAEEAGGAVDSGSWRGSRDAEPLLTVRETVDSAVPLAEVVLVSWLGSRDAESAAESSLTVDSAVPSLAEVVLASWFESPDAESAAESSLTVNSAVPLAGVVLASWWGSRDAESVGDSSFMAAVELLMK